jgi:hypothetical protein
LDCVHMIVRLCHKPRRLCPRRVVVVTGEGPEAATTLGTGLGLLDQTKSTQLLYQLSKKHPQVGGGWLWQGWRWWWRWW